MRTKEDVIRWLDANQGRFTAMSDAIWEHPEVAWQEFRSSKLQADFLAAEGFRVTWDLGGINTAFVAEWGERPADPRLSRRVRRPGRPLAEAAAHRGAGSARRPRPRLRPQPARHRLPRLGRRPQGVARRHRLERHRALLRLPRRRADQRQGLHGPRRRFRRPRCGAQLPPRPSQHAGQGQPGRRLRPGVPLSRPHRPRRRRPAPGPLGPRRRRADERRRQLPPRAHHREDAHPLRDHQRRQAAQRRARRGRGLVLRARPPAQGARRGRRPRPQDRRGRGAHDRDQRSR